MMQFIEVSSCDMEKGHLRCDANVSIRRRGEEKFGTKAEVKNLNSFRFLKQALDYEIERQIELIESGGRVLQETRLYNPDLGETFSMRSKEHAHDYRYFPEPDLVPLRISDVRLAEIRSTMPELPSAKRRRFVEEMGLREYDAEVLSATRAGAEYFERAAAVAGDAKATANWVMGDLAAALNADGKEFDACPVTPEHLGALIQLIARGEISGKIAKDVFAKMYTGGEPPDVIVQREGLKQISDTGALAKIVDDVLAGNPKQVEQYKSGKTSVIGFLVGQVMKASRGQANPQLVNEMLREKLG
jgi:aspartyl-tRNA(Asn)/glutamyl-tRNA(Gln) amidotransferase subunit B